MEKLSRSRQPNRPIHSLPKNPCNVVASGFGSSKATTYDDVFGGPPRFGAPSLSPRLEDYREIFGGVHLPSRGAASSIPVLDLPVIDGGDVLYDVSSPGFDYQEVFGGFQALDFAPSYDELLMEQSEGGDDDSCDEAWTPGETGSISGGTDDSGKSPYFSNGRDSYESIDVGTDFSISYNSAGHRGDYNTVNAIPHVASIPGYTSAADEMAYTEAMEGKQLKKTLSYPAHSEAKGHSSDNDLKAHRTYNRFQSCPRETFVTVTDISLKTLPSGLPPPSRPPPLFRRDSNSSASNCRTTGSEGSVGGSSSPLFDMETDASTAAVKHAMEKAQAKLKCAKELLERKRDGSRAHVKPSSVNGRMAGERKSNGNEMLFFAGSHEVEKSCGVARNSAEDKPGKKSISLQGSDKLEANDEWAEASQFFELVTTEKLRNAVEDDKLHNDMILHVVSQNEKLSTEEVFENQQERRVKEFIEINDAEKLLKRPEVPSEAQIHRRHEKKVREGKHILQKGIDEKSTKVVQQLKTEDEICDRLKKHENQVMTEHEENETLAQLATKPKKRELHQKLNDKVVKNQKQFKESLPREAGRKKEKDVFDWEENARKLREALAMDGNEKPLEATLERHIDGNKQKASIQTEENEKKLTEALERRENDKMFALDAEPIEDLIRLKEDHEKEQNDLRFKEDLAKADIRINEDLEQEVKERRLKEAREMEWNEMRMKEALEKEENELRMREAQERKENELRMREALEQAENMRIMKAALEQEALEREEKERQLTEIREKEERDRKLKEALEKEEKERRLKEAIEKEEMERRQREALEQEDREKRQTEVREREESEENPTEAAFKREENEIRLDETLNKEEKEKKQKEACEREESECHGEKTLKMDLKDGLQEGRHRREERTTMEINCKEAGALKQEKNRDLSGVKLGKREGLERLDEEVETSQSDEEEKPPKEDRDHLSTKDGLVGASDDTSCNRVKDRFKRAVEAGVYYGQRSAEEDKDVFETSFSISEDRTQYACEKENISNIEHGKAAVTHEEANESFLPHRVGKDMRETRREDVMKTAVPDVANQSTVRRSQEKEAERAKEERELENERLRKIEEEKEREREREKDRMAMGQRALAEARERLEKACSEARDKSLGEKLFMEARLRAEKAAVERATAEAPERAAGSAASVSKERMERSVSDKQFQSSNSFGASRYQNSSSAYVGGVNGESVQRHMSRLERHRRTAERVAKALAEKNMRDLLVQREQAERNRLAETLDADVKRWSGGKEGNIRALLSTLQYILGPESGWQPIHLTEVITSAAVKRAYRKATLCVHPDKLQQRGASIQQKYISEKVFDLLKDAWNRFNSEER